MPPEPAAHGHPVQVYANEQGKPQCGLCEREVEPDELYLLLRTPGTNHWSGWCQSCTRRFAQKYVSINSVQDVLDWIAVV